MSKRFKYSQLSEEAKQKARNDYQSGWLETHPNEFFDEYELDGFCQDTEDDLLYKEDGTL